MKLFISYAREDSDLVASVVDELERFHDCWVDWDDIPVGAMWMKEIQLGIASCNYFLFFASDHSLKSEACLKELRIALWLNKPILPIVFDPSAKVPVSLEGRQWVIFDDLDEGVKSILAGIGQPRSVWKLLALVEAFAIAYESYRLFVR